MGSYDMSLYPSQKKLRKGVVDNARVTLTLARQVEQHGEALDTLGEILLARGFFGRLKWLLTGR